MGMALQTKMSTNFVHMIQNKNKDVPVNMTFLKNTLNAQIGPGIGPVMGRRPSIVIGTIQRTNCNKD